MGPGINKIMSTSFNVSPFSINHFHSCCCSPVSYIYLKIYNKSIKAKKIEEGHLPHLLTGWIRPWILHSLSAMAIAFIAREPHIVLFFMIHCAFGSQVDDTEVISFLLSTEIIPLCLRTMEMGSELSKTVSSFASSNFWLFIFVTLVSEMPSRLLIMCL